MALSPIIGVMAEDPKKKTSETPIDDWDSLPLDPDFDDWDETPGPAPLPKAEKEAGLPLPEGEEKSPASGGGELEEADDLAAPSAPSTPSADDDEFGESPTPSGDDLEKAVSAEKKPEEDDFDSPAADGDDWDSPAEKTAGPDEKAAGAEAAEEEPEAGQPGLAPDQATLLAEEEPEAEDPLLPKKVELDIDDDLLPTAESHSEEAPEEEAPSPEADGASEGLEEAAAEAAAVEAPIKKRIPRMKLILVLIPAVLLLAGLAFGVYKLFLSPGETPPAATAPAVLPPPPVPEAREGEMTLEPFFINWPGADSKAPETIVELSLVLIYEDEAETLLIKRNMPIIRDIVFRLFLKQSPGLLDDGSGQNLLKAEMAELINKALGRPVIAAVRLAYLRRI